MLNNDWSNFPQYKMTCTNSIKLLKEENDYNQIYTEKEMYKKNFTFDYRWVPLEREGKAIYEEEK